MDALRALDLRRLADWNDPSSLSNRLRSRRFELFTSLVADLPRPLRVLDIGGTAHFWQQRGWGERDDVQVTLLNVAAVDVPHDGFTSVAGDAADLSRFGRGDFDVVFSNSVIEHLFTFDRQRAMAREIERLSDRYWVQTPSYWFPIEPHFHVPGWQWLPASARVELLRRRRCGWNGPEPDRARARQLVDEVRLLRAGEMRRLFPHGRIVRERFGGLTKSYVVVGHPDPAVAARLAA